MSNRKQMRAMDELEEEEISARPNRKQRRSRNALEAREPAAGGSNRKQMRAMDEQEEQAIAANRDPEQEALAYFLAEGMISEVLYRVSRGKEATVYCCQATPSMGAELLAVKVYCPREHRGFKNDAIYQEGRVITNGQVRRAVQKKSKFGRQVQFDLWISQEFEVLTTLHRAGADVPKPLAQTQSAILMEYFGNRARPASSLQGSELSHQEARATFDHLMNNIEILLANNSIHGDLSGEEQAVDSLLQFAKATFGDHVDVLVNNANIPFHFASFAEASWSDFSQKVSGELKSAFLMTKAVLPSMIAQHSGRIVYISAVPGKHPMDGLIAHGTAKGAIDAFARYIAHEFGPLGITSNVIAPGVTETDATAFLPDQFKQTVSSFTPLRRIGQPDDVARVIAFLASDDSRFVTGTYTPVDGGFSME